MTEENETAEETQEQPTGEAAPSMQTLSYEDLKNSVAVALNQLNATGVKQVTIVYLPNGELILNTSSGLPRHELLGLLEAVRDETRK